jgi:hypothetical protein
MIQLILRIIKRRTAAIIAALLLGLTALAGLPTASAQAASGLSVVAWYEVNGQAEPLYPPCDYPQVADLPSGSYVLQINNTCDTRVWLHAYIDGTIYTYCVSPGALAYSFARQYSDIQVTTITKPCDNGNGHFIADWGDPTNQLSNIAVTTTPRCLPSKVYIQTLYLFDVDNKAYDVSLSGAAQGHTNWVNCDTRLWLHVDDGGNSTQTICLSGNNFTQQYPDHTYWEVTVTNNQAPCSAGGPKYSLT